ncbi:MAG: Sugar phosphate permease [Chloroflexi bacterium]|jgi:ACS family hexuronate transporter-like MFS transporter|nr:MAG: Sugar phosphate permease [Chloroflexota bacterium]
MKTPPDQPQAPRAVFSIPYHWFVIGLSTFVVAGMAIGGTGIPVLSPFLREELSFSRTELGLITSLLIGGGLGTALIGGWLTDAWGVKRVLVYTAIALTVVVFGFSFVNSLWLALVLATAGGLAQAPSFPATSKAIVDWVPRRARGFGMGMKQTGVSGAGALVALIMPSIAQATSWRVAVMVMAGLTTIMLVALVVLYKDKPREDATVTKLDTGKLLRALVEVVRDRRLSIPTAYSCVFVGMQFLVGAYLILFLVERADLSPVVAGTFMGIAQITSIFWRVGWGVVSDAVFGSRRVIVLVIIGALGAVALFAIGLVNEGTPLLVVGLISALLGGTVLSWQGIYPALIMEVAGPDQSATMLGASNTFTRVFIIISPPLFGLVVDATDSYRLAWSIAAVIAAVTTLGLLALGRENPREQSS